MDENKRAEVNPDNDRVAEEILREALTRIEDLGGEDKVQVLARVSYEVQARVDAMHTTEERFNRDSLSDVLEKPVPEHMCLTSSSAGSWEGTFQNTVRALVDDLLHDGPARGMWIVTWGDVVLTKWQGTVVARDSVNVIFADEVVVPLEAIVQIGVLS